MTKDDERKALEQIKEIISGLGSDSYIGAAIDNTVLELAEDNISNDFLISTTSRIESAAREADTLRKELGEAKTKLETSETAYNIELNRLNESEVKNDNLRKEVAKWESLATENNNKSNLQAREIESLKAEILTLKAKLYDYMTA